MKQKHLIEQIIVCILVAPIALIASIFYLLSWVEAWICGDTTIFYSVFTTLIEVMYKPMYWTLKYMSKVDHHDYLGEKGVKTTMKETINEWDRRAKEVQEFTRQTEEPA